MPIDGSCTQISTHGLAAGKEGVLGTLYPSPLPPSGLCQGPCDRAGGGSVP